MSEHNISTYAYLTLKSGTQSTNETTIPHSQRIISLKPFSCLDRNEITYLIACFVNNSFL